MNPDTRTASLSIWRGVCCNQVLHTVSPLPISEYSKTAPSPQIHHGCTFQVDRYSLGETHTSAMGEGAIEGVAAQYKMTGTFATDFAFSRFGKTSALPRNSSLLTGVKMKRIKGAQSQTS